VLSEIRRAPANQVVDDMDAEAALGQEVHHVAPDEPGAPGDDGQGPCRHQATCLPFSALTLK
jgi:hypothetical protein